MDTPLLVGTTSPSSGAAAGTRRRALRVRVASAAALLAASALLATLLLRASNSASGAALRSPLRSSAAPAQTSVRMQGMRNLLRRAPAHLFPAANHPAASPSMSLLKRGSLLRSLSGAARAYAEGPGGGQRVRFAPSPTGSLHVGGARTALYNWLIAQKEDASKFVLRIEDTDVARSTKESEQSVIGDLDWLGLKWDEGPFRQSERGDIYKEMAQKLVDAGHAYPCFSTEEELEAAKAKAVAEGKNPKYDGKWRDADPELVEKMLADGVPHTYRFKVPSGAVVKIEDKVRGTVSWDAEATLGDFILLRSTGIPVYNFCVAVDDALMGISTVVRAEEHLTNTLRQVLILEALGYKPPEYAHLSLILGQDKQKLSKRHGATSVTQFKEEGFLPEAMINYLSLLGWNEGTEQEIYTVPELVEKFALERVIKSPAVFDMEKLRWVNSQHIRALAPEELQALVTPFFEKATPALPTSPEFIREATKMCQQRMELLTDAPTITRDALGHPLSETLETAEAKKLVEGDDSFNEFAAAVVSDFEDGKMPMPGQAENFEGDFKKWTKELGKKTGRKGKQLFMPLRLLLTGRMQGPEVPNQLLLSEAAGKEFGSKVLEDRIANVRTAFSLTPVAH